MTPDQRGMTVLSTDTCLELLHHQNVPHLAVSIGELPDIFPLNFVVDRGSIVFHTAKGTRFTAAIPGRGVAFKVDDVEEPTGETWSVVVNGHAVELLWMHDLLAALDLPLSPRQAAPKDRFVRIEPVEISGRRFHVVDPGVWSEQTRTPS